MDKDEEEKGEAGDADLVGVPGSWADDEEANDVDEEPPVEEVVFETGSCGRGHAEGGIQI